MKVLNSLLLISLLFCTHSLLAQIRTNDQIWDGNLDFYRTDTRSQFFANPSLQHFLSPRFSIGGQLQMEGDLTDGIQQMLLAPEVRYYLNPDHPKINWFAAFETQFTLYKHPDLNVFNPLEIGAGLGANVSLAEGLSLENKFSVHFKNLDSPFAFQRPTFRLEANFVHYASAGSGGTSAAFIPAIGKGNWLIGGSPIRLEYLNHGWIKNFSVDISPSVGYFITDHLLVGAEFGLTYNDLKTDFTLPETNIDTHTLSFRVDPYLRYYTAKPDSRVQPYLELRGSWVYSEIRNQVSSTNPFTSSRNFSASIGGGINVFLNKRTALQVGLNLGKDLSTGQTQVGLQVGLRYFLSKK